MKKTALPLVVAMVLLGAVGILVARELATYPNGARGTAREYVVDTDESGAVTLYEEISRFPAGTDLPKGIAAGADGNLYVCGSSGISVLDATGLVTGSFALEQPAYCVAVDERGMAYIGAGDTVVVLNTDTGEQSMWAPMDDRSILTSIAVYKNTVYVADAGARMVWVYDTGGMMTGYIDHDYIIPSPYFDVAVDTKGDLWVADTGRHTVMKIGADGSIAASWGIYAMDVTGFSGCCNPANFAILPNGMFITAEKGLQRIKIHDSNGGFAGLIEGTRSLGAAPEGLDIAVTADGSVYVLRSASGEISKFQRRPA